MPERFTANDEKVFDAISCMRLATIYEVMDYTGFERKNAEKHIGRVKRRGLIFPYTTGFAKVPMYSDDQKYFGRLSELTFKHELLISKIHAWIHRNFSIEQWTQDKSIWSKYVRPDAFFTLENHDQLIDYYLEADNYQKGKSDNRPQMLKKYQGYFSLFQHNLEQGKPPFRALTVTTSQERAVNLAKLAEQVIERRQRLGYIFTTIERLKDATAPICFVTYEDDKEFPILP